AGLTLLRPLRDVSGRERGALAKEKIFHVLGDEILRFFLPRHQPVLVQDHLHPFFPELPRLGRDVVVDPLTELAWPRHIVEAGQVLLKFDAEDRPPAFVCYRRFDGRSRFARVSHGAIVPLATRDRRRTRAERARREAPARQTSRRGPARR